MKRYDEVVRDYDEITDVLMNDTEELMRFLDFSSQMYKVRFADAALTYIQNPAATKVADLQKWNKLGRYVKRKTHSIGVFGEGHKVHHLYDVTQTFGKELPKLWKFDNELGAQLLNSMRKDYGKNFESLEEALKAAAQKSVNDHMQLFESICEMRDLSMDEASRLYNTVLSVVEYTVLRRTELNGDYSFSREKINTDALSACKGRREFRQVLDLAQIDAHFALVKIEKEVLRLIAIKEEEIRYERTYGSSKRNNIQNERSRTMGSAADVSVESRGGRISEPPDRILGQAMDKVDEASGSIRLGEGYADNGGALVLHSEGNRRGGRSASERVGGDLSQRQSSSIGGERLYGSSEMGEGEAALLRENNQGGNNQSLQKIEGSVIQNNSAVAASKSLPLVDIEIIKSIIRNDVIISSKRSEIVHFFEINQDFDERTDYVKKIFENSHASNMKINGKTAGYIRSENGLTLWTGSDTHHKSESGVEWQSIQSYIAQMISDDDFIKEKTGANEQLSFFGDVDELTEPAQSIFNATSNIPDEIRAAAKKSLIVNLYGGPGAGKSTAALQLVAELKKRGYHAEYVSEVAKDLVYAKAFDILDGSEINQRKILEEQKNRLDMAAGNVDVAVTDSPLLLNMVYLKEQKNDYFAEVLSQYNEYNNFNILISRDTSVPFEVEGRIHNLEESIAKDKEIIDLLKNNHVSFENINRDDISNVADAVLKQLDASVEKTFAEQVDDVLAGKANRYNDLKVCDTPQILLDVGCEHLPMFYTQRHLRDALKPKGTTGESIHYHGLNAEQIKKMPVLLENPVIVYDSLSRNDSIIIVTSEVDDDNMPIIAAIKPNGKGKYDLELVESNFVLSFHGRNNFESQINRAVEQDKVLYYNKEKSQEMFSVLGLHLSKGLNNLDFNTIIHQSRNIVKNEKSFAEQENVSLGETLPQNDLHAAFEKLYQNHNFSDEAKLFLERAETQMQRNDYENLSTKLFKIPAFATNYGSPSRINKLLFDGKLKDIIAEVNGYIGNNNQPELHAEISSDDVEIENDKTSEHDENTIVEEQKAEYMLLSRLKQDCDYYLGNGGRNARHLWAETPEKQIKMMKELYSTLVVKPEWLSENDILNYEKEMILPEKVDLMNDIREVQDNTESLDGIAHTYVANVVDVVEISGPKAKFKANTDAIVTLQRIEAEHRYATPEEQSVMAKYSGWGGIPQAFDSGNKEWAAEYNQLSSLLTEEEYEAARKSTLTSFYTPPEIISGVYQALTRFGFAGGNVLEPAMATGNFFAQMPENMRKSSKRYGIELDSISGRIAKQLFPDDNIQIRGFETETFSDNSFDVVVGNVPFGDYGVNDKKYNKYKFKIHDYFAAKAVDKVKPGGIVAIVTSKFTMDKQDDKCRRYLAERCELIGAVRLPSNAFKSSGTDTTTDIIFLKKREEGLSIVEENWIKFGETANGIPCNQYFVDNPDMVLGTMAWDERMKGKYGENSKVTTCIADETTPFVEQLRAAISKLEGSISTLEETEEYEDVQDTRNILPADPSVRNFTHTVIDGKMYFRENEVMTEVSASDKTLDRMFGMHKIRELALGIINAQSDGCSDEELESRQKELNQTYDLFVTKYGYISNDVNRRCFQEDDDYNTIAALEVYDEKSKTINKAALFSKRTIKQETVVTSVDNEDEALQVSLDRLGKVDIPYMAKLLKSNEEAVISLLENKIYRDPEKVVDNETYSGYVDESEYLSGNVRAKLKIALAYADKVDSSYARNVEALKKVLPTKLEAGDINVRIGANWIELDDYNAFLAEYAQANTVGYYAHPVTRTVLGEYKIYGKTQDRSVAATETYGTSRLSSYEIFEKLLNQRDIVVRDRKADDNGNVTYVANIKETRLAKEKARKMEEAFKEWVWKDIDRREKYVDKYNELFNSIRGREYDGSFQSFPGMNPQIELRPHQKNAVMRAKLNGNTLLAHVVGAGKSFEMYASVMEKKRLGLINKACMVVPKHLVLQTASEWIRLYPNVKLLVAHPKDFTADNRKRFIARCVTGDYDAVIMSVQQFERIPMSDEYRQQFIRTEINKITQALEETDKSERISVKALEREKQKLEERLQKLLDTPKDSALCFEKLGFDYLVCDEAHTYKNCFVSTKMSNVKGVQTSAAKKSEDMLMKTQYMNKKYGCNNILFATGTPVSNSMVELYVMQRYLRPDLLEKAGVSNFDDWATTFGQVVTQLELKPEGNGFRMTNRFSKFVNIPELMQMYKEFADIQTADTINLPGVPKLKGGQPIVVTAKPDDYQKAYMKELAARSEAIHSGAVKSNEDNMLKITNEARNLGLDSRCIFKNAIPAPDSKVMKLIDNVEKLYQDTDKQKGVQIIFCDIAINEDTEHFSVYKAIKNELVNRNIPSDEICFAGDATTDRARADMFKQLRAGEKRVILASTQKLGTGANIQDRVCAIHHLDIPWKPSDLIQQDGRGVRQGNMYGEVAVYHYLTEETFDAYMMGIITNKAKFINQIMTSKSPARVADDVDEMVLTYSQMQAAASGNPLIKEKIELDNDIATLNTLKAEHINQTLKLQELAEKILPQKLESYKVTLVKASADYKMFHDSYEQQPEFSIIINGQNFDERSKAGDELEKAIIKSSVTGESFNVGNYRGFELSVEKVPSTDLLTASDCAAVLHGEMSYSVEVSLKNSVGNIRRIENLTLNAIGQKVRDLKESVKICQADLDEAQNNYNKPFERQKELEAKMKRLDIVNAELSGREKRSDGTAVDRSAMYKTPDGNMMEVTKAGEHTAVGKLANSDKTVVVVAEEPIISNDIIEYRSLQQFNTALAANDYAKTAEKLSEEKSLSEIGKDIDTVLQKSKLRAGVYNLIGARDELKARYTGSDIKSCLAMTLLCYSDSKFAKDEYLDWAEVYCQEHGIDYVNLKSSEMPCKSHINLINGLVHRSISQKEINRAVEMNATHEASEELKI